MELEGALHLVKKGIPLSECPNFINNKEDLKKQR